jgi:hypothetical protein
MDFFIACAQLAMVKRPFCNVFSNSTLREKVCYGSEWLNNCMIGFVWGTPYLTTTAFQVHAILEFLSLGDAEKVMEPIATCLTITWHGKKKWV